MYSFKLDEGQHVCRPTPEGTMYDPYYKTTWGLFCETQ